MGAAITVMRLVQKWVCRTLIDNDFMHVNYDRSCEKGVIFKSTFYHDSDRFSACSIINI